MKLKNIILNYPDYVKENIIFKDDYFFFKKPIESKEFKSFYYIPFFSNYLINKEGVVFSLITKKIKKLHIFKPSKKNLKNIKGGYLRTRTIRDDGVKTITGIHRLLCLAFLKYNSNPFKLFVNHKDGNPKNNNLINLEWVTPKENLLHALKNNLMPNSKKNLKIYDVKKKKIFIFNSITDCSIFLNWSFSKVSKRINKNILHHDGILINTIDKEFPDLKTITKSNIGVSYKIKALNSKKVIFFKSLEKAGKFFNKAPITIKNYILNNKKLNGFDLMFV